MRVQEGLCVLGPDILFVRILWIVICTFCLFFLQNIQHSGAEIQKYSAV